MNLNTNIENDKLLDRFLATTNQVAAELKTKYGEQWNVPTQVAAAVTATSEQAAPQKVKSDDE